MARLMDARLSIAALVIAYIGGLIATLVASILGLTSNDAVNIGLVIGLALLAVQLVLALVLLDRGDPYVPSGSQLNQQSEFPSTLDRSKAPS